MEEEPEAEEVEDTFHLHLHHQVQEDQHQADPGHREDQAHLQDLGHQKDQRT